MTASRASRPPLFLGLAVGLLLSGFFEAGAKSVDRPIPLSPSSDAFSPLERGAGERPSWSSPLPSDVSMRDLEAKNLDAIGLLDEQQGGLGREMWAGSQLAFVQKALSLTPAAPSPAMHALTRRLLLSEAIPPAGDPESSTSLIEIRVQKLWELGEIEDLIQLAEKISPERRTPALRETLTKALVAAGSNDAACALAEPAPALGANGPWLQKLAVFCKIAAQKTGEAQLDIDLLRDQNIDAPLFFAAWDTLSGQNPAPIPEPDWEKADIFDLALAIKAGIPLSAGIVARIKSYPLLRFIAAATAIDENARLLALENSCHSGAEDIEKLQEFYQSVSFSQNELMEQVGGGGPRQRALLYRAALSQTHPAVRAGIIHSALRVDGDDYLLTARLFAQQIAAIQPEQGLSQFAVSFARALIAVGDYPQAEAWIDLVEHPRAQRGEEADPARSLWLLRALLADDGDALVPTRAATQWRKSRRDLSPDAQKRRLTVAYSLLSAFGRKVPAQEWLLLFDGAQPPAKEATNPAIFHGLRIASEDLRMGETICLAMTSLGDEGLTQTPPNELYRAIEAIRLIGLNAEARSLAIEAAVVNGI